jgi:hypothetical protein
MHKLALASLTTETLTISIGDRMLMSIHYQWNAKGCLESPNVTSFLGLDFTRSDPDCWPAPMLPFPACLIKGPIIGQFAGSTPRAEPLKAGRSTWFIGANPPALTRNWGSSSWLSCRNFSEFTAPSWVIRQSVSHNLYLNDSVVRQFGGRPTIALCGLTAPHPALNNRR